MIMRKCDHCGITADATACAGWSYGYANKATLEAGQLLHWLTLYFDNAGSGTGIYSLEQRPFGKKFDHWKRFDLCPQCVCPFIAKNYGGAA